MEEEVSYMCLSCNSNFKNIEKLLNHLKVHYESLDRFTCDNCKRTFRSTKIYDEHIRYHLNKIKDEIISDDNHKNVANSYNVSNQTFVKLVLNKSGADEKAKIVYELIKIESNLTTGNNLLFYQCINCETYFNDELEFNNHMKLISDQIFNCKYCKSVFCQDKILQEHVLTCSSKYNLDNDNNFIIEEIDIKNEPIALIKQDNIKLENDNFGNNFVSLQIVNIDGVEVKKDIIVDLDNGYFSIDKN